MLDDASAAAADVAKLLARVPDRAAVVFDLRDLSGYPVSARDRWSGMLKEHRSRISVVVWVTAKTTYRMVARAVGLLTGIPTHVVDDMLQVDDILVTSN